MAALLKRGLEEDSYAVDVVSTGPDASTRALTTTWSSDSTAQRPRAAARAAELEIYWAAADQGFVLDLHAITASAHAAEAQVMAIGDHAAGSGAEGVRSCRRRGRGR